MPLDVGDYEKISAMIMRVEAKIDAMRKELVGIDVQSIVNAANQNEIVELKRRIAKMENAPSIWLMRLGVMASVALSLIELLAHIKILP